MKGYQIWKQERVQKDANVIAILNNIANKYGYEVVPGLFGIELNEMSGMKRRFARAEERGLEIQVNTTASSWTVEEAVIMAKEIEEATRLAAELNTIIKALDNRYESEFEEFMKEKGNK